MTNEMVKRFNAKVLTRYFELSSDRPHTYYAFDKPKDDYLALLVEVYNASMPSGFPPYELTLKAGVPVMCINNIKPDISLVNGTRMIVSSYTPYSI